MSDLELGCSRRVGAVFIEMRCYQQSVDADNSSAQTLCLLEMSLWSWVSNPLGMFRKHTVSEWAIAWLSITEFFQTKRIIATNPTGKPNGYFVIAVAAATLCLDFILIIQQNSITTIVELGGILACILTENNDSYWEHQLPIIAYFLRDCSQK